MRTARRPSCCCPRGRSSIRGSGSPRSRYLARRFRVVTFDGRGNGHSDRPTTRPPTARELLPTRWRSSTRPDVESACVVGLSLGALTALRLATQHPDRVAGAILLAGNIPHLRRAPRRPRLRRRARDPRGCREVQPPLLAARLRGLRATSSSSAFPEPHSTQAARGRGVVGPRHGRPDADPDPTRPPRATPDPGRGRGPVPRCDLPGARRSRRHDLIIPLAMGERAAELIGAELVRMEGSGHARTCAIPSRSTCCSRDFAQRVTGAAADPAATWTRPAIAPKRALLRVVADRPRPRVARCRDRRRAAPPGPRASRSTGWPRSR